MNERQDSADAQARTQAQADEATLRKEQAESDTAKAQAAKAQAESDTLNAQAAKAQAEADSAKARNDTADAQAATAKPGPIPRTAKLILRDRTHSARERTADQSRADRPRANKPAQNRWMPIRPAMRARPVRRSRNRSSTTRDSARGLIVSMSDVASTQRTVPLNPAHGESLEVAGIRRLPGLTSKSTEYGQRRGDARSGTLPGESRRICARLPGATR